MSIFRIPRVVVATLLATLLVALMAAVVRPAAQAAAPPPVAGELLPSADGPAAVEEIPQLICPADAAARRAAHPGALLACQEQQFSAKSAAGLLALAQRLEAAGLFDEAGHRGRTLRQVIRSSPSTPKRRVVSGTWGVFLTDRRSARTCCDVTALDEARGVVEMW